MNTQHAIESIAAAIYCGDMTAEEARTINANDGFTIDRDGNDDGSFSRTEGVKLSEENFAKAVEMAESGEFPY